MNKKIKKKIIKKSRLIAIKGDFILVLEKNKEEIKYSLPGGVKKKDETIEASLIRETIEEIGICLDVEQVIFFTSIIVEKDDCSIHKKYFVVDGTKFSPKNVESHKFKSVKWIPWYQAYQLMDKADKNVVKQYFAKTYHLNLAIKKTT